MASNDDDATPQSAVDAVVADVNVAAEFYSFLIGEHDDISNAMNASNSCCSWGRSLVNSLDDDMGMNALQMRCDDEESISRINNDLGSFTKEDVTEILENSLSDSQVQSVDVVSAMHNIVRDGLEMHNGAPSSIATRSDILESLDDSSFDIVLAECLVQDDGSEECLQIVKASSDLAAHTVATDAAVDDENDGLARKIRAVHTNTATANKKTKPDVQDSSGPFSGTDIHNTTVSTHIGDSIQRNVVQELADGLTNADDSDASMPGAATTATVHLHSDKTVRDDNMDTDSSPNTKTNASYKNSPSAKSTKSDLTKSPEESSSDGAADNNGHQESPKAPGNATKKRLPVDLVSIPRGKNAILGKDILTLMPGSLHFLAGTARADQSILDNKLFCKVVRDHFQERLEDDDFRQSLERKYAVIQEIENILERAKQEVLPDSAREDVRDNNVCIWVARDVVRKTHKKERLSQKSWQNTYFVNVATNPEYLEERIDKLQSPLKSELIKLHTAQRDTVNVPALNVGEKRAVEGICNQIEKEELYIGSFFTLIQDEEMELANEYFVKQIAAKWTGKKQETSKRRYVLEIDASDPTKLCERYARVLDQDFQKCTHKNKNPPARKRRRPSATTTSEAPEPKTVTVEHFMNTFDDKLPSDSECIFVYKKMPDPQMFYSQILPRQWLEERQGRIRALLLCTPHLGYAGYVCSMGDRDRGHFGFVSQHMIEWKPRKPHDTVGQFWWDRLPSPSNRDLWDQTQALLMRYGDSIDEMLRMNGDRVALMEHDSNALSNRVACQYIRHWVSLDKSNRFFIWIDASTEQTVEKSYLDAIELVACGKTKYLLGEWSGFASPQSLADGLMSILLSKQQLGSCQEWIIVFANVRARYGDGMFRSQFFSAQSNWFNSLGRFLFTSNCSVYVDTTEEPRGTKVPVILIPDGMVQRLDDGDDGDDGDDKRGGGTGNDGGAKDGSGFDSKDYKTSPDGANDDNDSELSKGDNNGSPDTNGLSSTQRDAKPQTFGKREDEGGDRGIQAQAGIVVREGGQASAYAAQGIDSPTDRVMPARKWTAIPTLPYPTSHSSDHSLNLSRDGASDIPIEQDANTSIHPPVSFLELGNLANSELLPPEEPVETEIPIFTQPGVLQLLQDFQLLDRCPGIQEIIRRVLFVTWGDFHTLIQWKQRDWVRQLGARTAARLHESTFALSRFVFLESLVNFLNRAGKQEDQEELGNSFYDVTQQDIRQFDVEIDNPSAQRQCSLELKRALQHVVEALEQEATATGMLQVKRKPRVSPPSASDYYPAHQVPPDASSTTRLSSVPGETQQQSFYKREDRTDLDHSLDDYLFMLENCDQLPAEDFVDIENHVDTAPEVIRLLKDFGLEDDEGIQEIRHRICFVDWGDLLDIITWTPRAWVRHLGERRAARLWKATFCLSRLSFVGDLVTFLKGDVENPEGRYEFDVTPKALVFYKQEVTNVMPARMWVSNLQREIRHSIDRVQEASSAHTPAGESFREAASDIAMANNTLNDFPPCINEVPHETDKSACNDSVPHETDENASNDSVGDSVGYSIGVLLSNGGNVPMGDANDFVPTEILVPVVETVEIEVGEETGQSTDEQLYRTAAVPPEVIGRDTIPSLALLPEDKQLSSPTADSILSLSLLPENEQPSSPTLPLAPLVPQMSANEPDNDAGDDIDNQARRQMDFRKKCILNFLFVINLTIACLALTYGFGIRVSVDNGNSSKDTNEATSILALPDSPTFAPTMLPTPLPSKPLTNKENDGERRYLRKRSMRYRAYLSSHVGSWHRLARVPTE